jgi:hypothetical protein
MIGPRADRPGRITLGADKGYGAGDFVNELRSMNVSPHVAAKIKGPALKGKLHGPGKFAISAQFTVNQA